MSYKRSELGFQVTVLAKQCGGEDELAFRLHVTPRTVWSYRSGRSHPLPTVCLQLARICRVLYGDKDPRAQRDWWLALDRPEVEA